MGYFVSTCVPHDAKGSTVNLNTEYMFRSDGLKMKVLRFEYYRDDLWIALVQEHPLKSDKYEDGERYEVSNLYLYKPKCANEQQASNKLRSLNGKLFNLITSLTDGKDIQVSLRTFAYINLAIEKEKLIGTDTRSLLILIFKHFMYELGYVLDTLENSDAE